MSNKSWCKILTFSLSPFKIIIILNEWKMCFVEYAAKDGLIFGRCDEQDVNEWSERKQKTNEKWEIKFKSIDKTWCIHFWCKMQRERQRRGWTSLRTQSLIQEVQKIWKFQCFNIFLVVLKETVLVPHYKQPLSWCIVNQTTVPTHTDSLIHSSIAICHWLWTQIPQ